MVNRDTFTVVEESLLPELLHDELDRREVPFRSPRGELIQRFGDASGDRWVNLELPMTRDFVDSQVDLLRVRVHPQRDTDHPCPALTGAAGDFAAVVADLTQRFGEPDDTSVADSSRWTIGERSVITVKAEPGGDGESLAGCTLSFSHGYMRPYTDAETRVIESFHVLHADASNSFGWTMSGEAKFFMLLASNHFVRLTDPNDIDYVLVTEYAKARSSAFSTIELVLRDGMSQSLAQAELGAFTTVATTLADALDLEIRTVQTTSA